MTHTLPYPSTFFFSFSVQYIGLFDSTIVITSFSNNEALYTKHASSKFLMSTPDFSYMPKSNEFSVTHLVVYIAQYIVSPATGWVDQTDNIQRYCKIILVQKKGDNEESGGINLRNFWHKYFSCISNFWEPSNFSRLVKQYICGKMICGMNFN